MTAIRRGLSGAGWANAIKALVYLLLSRCKDTLYIARPADERRANPSATLAELQPSQLAERLADAIARSF